MKRTSSPAEECNARYAQPYKAKQTFGLHTNRDQTNRYFRDDFVTGMMKNDNEEQDCKEGITKRTTNMSSNCDQNFTAYDIRTTGPRTVDSDSGNENNKASKTKSANDVLKADANGIITPLMANGLKKTFVRCHNNMLTIVEEKQESHYPSPFMDKGRNPLQSPKRHVNIEQLRLGFSADSKSLFSLKNNSRPPVEVTSRLPSYLSEQSPLRARSPPWQIPRSTQALQCHLG